jgi:uncharacterized protein
LALPVASAYTAANKRQIYWALLLLFLSVTIVIVLNGSNREASLNAAFGLIFGYILQRSRFCFAAGFRDIFMIRNTAVTRAILVLIMLTSLGFFAVHTIRGGLLPDSGIIYPVGLHTLAGGILFGFGMVIAGNCVSGCLMRMGEGYLMQWITYFGLLLGSALGAWNLSFWGPFSIERSPVIFIPDHFGWPGAIAIYACLTIALYLLALWYERGTLKRLKFKKELPSAIISELKTSAHSIVSGGNWSYGLGAVALALTSTLLFGFWGKPGGITSGITHLAGWLSCRVYLTPCDWYYFTELIYLESRRIYLEHPQLYFSSAIITGSLFASLLHREFRIRRPKSLKFVFSALIGGILLGYSSRVAMGCNFGGFWSGASSYSLHAWVFGLFILLGAYLGGKIFMRYLL